MKRKLYLGRSAILGLRLGAFLLGIMAALALAHIGLQTYQARTGLPGGELTIIPAFALFFYVGWTAREGSLRRKADHQKGGKALCNWHQRPQPEIRRSPSWVWRYPTTCGSWPIRQPSGSWSTS